MTLTKLSNINAMTRLVASVKATESFKAFPSVYGLVLTCLKADGTHLTQAEIALAISYIRVQIDGETTWDIAGRDLEEMYNFFYVDNVSDGLIELRFSQDFYSDREAGDVYALGSSGVGTMTLEVMPSAAIQGLDRILIERRTDFLLAEPLGLHRYIRRYTRKMTDIGKQSFSDIETPNNEVIQQIMIAADSADIRSISFSANDVQYFTEDTPLVINGENKANNFNPSDSNVVLNFGGNGNRFDGLPLVDIETLNIDIDAITALETFDIYIMGARQRIERG